MTDEPMTATEVIKRQIEVDKKRQKAVEGLLQPILDKIEKILKDKGYIK